MASAREPWRTQIDNTINAIIPCFIMAPSFVVRLPLASLLDRALYPDGIRWHLGLHGDHYDQEWPVGLLNIAHCTNQGALCQDVASESQTHRFSSFSSPLHNTHGRAEQEQGKSRYFARKDPLIPLLQSHTSWQGRAALQHNSWHYLCASLSRRSIFKRKRGSR